jgi:hypothetical protein
VKFNPFRPGKAVTPDLFAGRVAQLIEINKSLSQTKHSNAMHFVAYGERGIGKSSLLDAAAAAATGDQVEHLDSYDFMVVPVGLTPRDDDLSIVRKVGARLERELAKRKKVEELLKSTWSLLQRIEVAGTGLKDKGTDISPIVDPVGDLARIMAEALAGLGDKVDGILVLFDEADPAAPALGRVAKQLVDSLGDERCDRVCLGVAGMPGVISGMREGHESAPRIFEPLPLEVMNREESNQIVHKGLAEIQSKVGTVITIQDDALLAIAGNSNGYPQFVQQIASSAYEADSDNNITLDDVINGMFSTGGAIDALGAKHFQVPYFDLIKSDEYRAVLLVMADSDDGYIAKDAIRQATNLKENTLSNALHALKDRGIIQAHPAKRGEYRLPSRAFALYIKLASRGREHLRDTKVA